MEIKTKTAFLAFDGEVLVVTKSLIDGYMNTTHFGTGLTPTPDLTINQLEDQRKKAEDYQVDYFNSEAGKKFIDFQREQEIETYDNFDDVGVDGTFPDVCYPDAKAFISSLS